jgi:hypothetical protein
MASLLKLALEGQLGGMLGYLDTSNGQQHTGSWLTHGQNTGGRGPEAVEQGQRQDLVELKGPLAIQLQEALAKVYDKHADDRKEDEFQKEAEVAVESQANDALMQQELIDNIRIMSEGEESDNSTTVYGVDAADVKPEDIVEVDQASGVDKKNLVVVMVADQDGDAKPQLDAMATALESLCERKGIALYFSMEELAHHALGPTGKVQDDDPYLITVMEFTHKLFDNTMTPDEWFFPKGYEVKSIYRVKARQLCSALTQHFACPIDPKAQLGLKTPRKLAAYFKKHAPKD